MWCFKIHSIGNSYFTLIFWMLVSLSSITNSFSKSKLRFLVRSQSVLSVIRFRFSVLLCLANLKAELLYLLLDFKGMLSLHWLFCFGLLSQSQSLLILSLFNFLIRLLYKALFLFNECLFFHSSPGGVTDKNRIQKLDKFQWVEA